MKKTLTKGKSDNTYHTALYEENMKRRFEEIQFNLYALEYSVKRLYIWKDH